MEKNNLDKSLTSKGEEKMIRGIGEKAHEQKHQELESLMVCMLYYLFIFYKEIETFYEGQFKLYMK
jgi:hypothetical protein